MSVSMHEQGPFITHNKCRWNQIVSCTLRDSVYLPVMDLDFGRRIGPTHGDESRSKVKSLPGSRGQPAGYTSYTLKRMVAQSAAFLASGLMHEVMNWWVCCVMPGQRMILHCRPGI